MKKFKNFLFTIYLPVITRIERYRATRMWFEGVRLAEEMYKELNSPRVYLLFDKKHMCWSPMTFRQNKLLKPAFLTLRTMGKMRLSKKIKTHQDLEQFSFYFTRSKKNARSANSDNSVRETKLKLWIDYYMSHLSEPMRKCREYQQACLRQCLKVEQAY